MEVEVGGFKGKSKTQHQNVGPPLDLPHTGHGDFEVPLRSRRDENEAGLQIWAPDFST